MGLFIKVLVTNFPTKVAQLFGCCFENRQFKFKKTDVATFEQYMGSNTGLLFIPTSGHTAA